MVQTLKAKAKLAEMSCDFLVLLHIFCSKTDARRTCGDCKHNILMLIEVANAPRGIHEMLRSKQMQCPYIRIISVGTRQFKQFGLVRIYSWARSLDGISRNFRLPKMFFPDQKNNIKTTKYVFVSVVWWKDAKIFSFGQRIRCA